jgi:hypothetical protein
MELQGPERKRMAWRHLRFWRRSPVADLDALATFIDEQSAFLVQKGLHEYPRARAGHYAKVLFHERAFHEALERSRWQAYPLGLAMVGEVVEGVLRPYAEGDVLRHTDNLRVFVLRVFDRYPAPASLGDSAWREARAELHRRLQLLGLHPPKRVIDVPAPYAKTYWDLMPIAKEVRSRDFPTTHSYLKIMLCNIHDDLAGRADLPALARQLREVQAGSAAAGLVPQVGAGGRST